MKRRLMGGVAGGMAGRRWGWRIAMLLLVVLCGQQVYGQAGTMKQESFAFDRITVTNADGDDVVTEPKGTGVGYTIDNIVAAKVGGFSLQFTTSLTSSSNKPLWKEFNSGTKYVTYLQMPGKYKFELTAADGRDIAFQKVTWTLNNTNINTIKDKLSTTNGSVSISGQKLTWEASAGSPPPSSVEVEYTATNSATVAVQLVDMTVEYVEVGSGLALGVPTIAGASPFLTSTLVSISKPADTPADAQIRYTTDGSEPTASSYLYTAPFELTESTQVRARLFAADAEPGEIADKTFTKLVPTEARPKIMAGATQFTESTLVTLQANVGESIYYTLDGSDPEFALQDDGTLRPVAPTALYEDPIRISSTLTLKAVCVVAGYAPGAIVEQQFSLIGVSATPQIKGARRFLDSTEVSIVVEGTEGASIFYTTDGSVPDATSTSYTGPFTIESKTTVRAVALEEGKALSEVAEATFTPIARTAVAPTINGNAIFAGTTQVFMEAEAPIYYSIGAAPTFTMDSEGVFTPGVGTELYAQPFDISESCTIYAVCMRANEAPGLPVSRTFSLLEESSKPQIEAPLWFAETAEMKLTAAEGATIFYVVGGGLPRVKIGADGSVAAAEGTLIYGAPISISATTTITALAVEPGKAPSATVAFTSTKAARVAQPTISGWSYFDASANAAISISGSGAIYYTLDGTEPTSASTLYAEPFTVDATTTVRAIAFADGSAPSLVSSFTATKLLPTERTATIGGNTEFDKFTTITLSTGVGSDHIYYTLDGSEPVLFLNHTTGQYNCTAPTMHYTAPVGISRSATLKVVVAAAGAAPGPVVTQEFVNVGRAPSPVVSVPAFFIGSTTVSIEGPEEIYYTLDGTAPTDQSTRYTEPFTIEQTTTIRAVGCQEGLRMSAIVSATSEKLQPTAAVPQISGTTIFATSTTVSITAPSSTSIYYTLDGSEPAFDVNPEGAVVPRENTLKYTAPFALDATTTVCAVAVEPGKAPGTMSSVRFVKAGIVETPDIRGDLFFLNETRVALSAPAEASIRYTLDGSEPTSESSLYDEPFVLSTTTLVRARAFVAGMVPSAVAEREFTHLAPTEATVEIDGERSFIESTTVTLRAASGCRIYYTLDGNAPQLQLQADGTFVPAEGTLLYASPLTISESTDVQAVALQTCCAPGAVATATFTKLGQSEPVDIIGARFFVNTTTVELKAKEGASVYYTLDGSDPTAESNLYSDPITIEATTELKAIAIEPDHAPSAVSEALFKKLTPTEIEPALPGGTTHIEIDDEGYVELEADGCRIYYTLNGTAPQLELLADDGSFAATGTTTFVYTQPIRVVSAVEIRAVAVRAGFAPSAETVIQVSQRAVSATPRIVGNAYFVDSQQVEIQADGTIYYTLDGTEPQAVASQAYTGPITLAQTTRVRAIAIEEGKRCSAQTEQRFVALERTENPRIPASATFSQSMEIAIEAPLGAAVYYTLDGSDPTYTILADGSVQMGSDAIRYEQPIQLQRTAHLSAIALLEGKAPSRVVTATYVRDDHSGINAIELEQAGIRIEGTIVYAPDGTEIYDVSGQRRPVGRPLAHGVYIVRTPKATLKIRL